jgi:hypothetical protein
MYETNEELQIRMNNEHYQKYEELAQKIGVRYLIPLISPNKDKIRAALLNGDVYLNGISLRWWDIQAGASNLFSWQGGPKLHWNFPWTPKNANGLSLAERVCILKHVAKYHLGE